MKRIALPVLGLTLLAVPALGEARVWTDVTGRHKTEAELVAVEKGVVRLRKTDGNVVSVPINRLSAADRAFIEAERQASVPGEAPRLELTELVAQVDPAVVRIDTGQAIGSGFLADNGLVVTSYHVIAGAKTAKVTFHNKLSANVDGYLYADPKEDLALLRISTNLPLPSLPVRAGLPLKGEQVVAIGAPKGFTGTVSQGIVSAIRRGDEIRDIVGGKAEEFDNRTIWIQTTTPISSGNSGGPLVDMQGRVVGLNTWTRTGAQNLNFAVAATEIKEVLAHGSGRSRPLAGLPAPRAAESAEVVSYAGPLKIELPSGKELSQAMFQVPDDFLSTLFPKDALLYVQRYPNNEIKGVYVFNKNDGKLHGKAARLHEDGKLHMLAEYYLSDRNGSLLVLDESQAKLLYAEYKRGNRDGVLCFFQNDRPRVVQEWDKEKLIAEYIVSWTGAGPKVVSKNECRDSALGTELTDALTQLADLEAQIEVGEDELKKELREWYQEETLRLKRAAAARLGPRRRQGIIGRENQRRESNLAAVKEELRRRGF
jgi:S1-C subfamily serine protease/antitoxin component YwqK of YwqJK toxin-antitoxin module